MFKRLSTDLAWSVAWYICFEDLKERKKEKLDISLASLIYEDLNHMAKTNGFLNRRPM